MSRALRTSPSEAAVPVRGLRGTQCGLQFRADPGRSSPKKMAAPANTWQSHLDLSLGDFGFGSSAVTATRNGAQGVIVETKSKLVTASPGLGLRQVET